MVKLAKRLVSGDVAESQLYPERDQILLTIKAE